MGEMFRTKLMEVPHHQRDKLGSGCMHRATKEQTARFKRKVKDGCRDLSRFEPRVKDLIEKLSQESLSYDEFPALDGTDRNAKKPAVLGSSQQAGDQWSFASWPQASGNAASVKASTPKDVTQRIVVFVLGGITHSELRAAAEACQSLPSGSEVLLGGTAVLTPRKFMHAFRRRSCSSVTVEGRLDP